MSSSVGGNVTVVVPLVDGVRGGVLSWSGASICGLGFASGLGLGNVRVRFYTSWTFKGPARETGAIYKFKEYKFMGLFTSVFICPRSCQLLSRAARVFVCDRPRPLLRDSFWCSWGAGL